MALSITIGGVDRTANVRFESVNILQTVAANADQADLVISVAVAEGWRPKAANEVIILNGTTKEFAGICIDVEEEQATTLTRLRYKLACRDYVHLFDRRLVVQNYAAQAASLIAIDVVTTYTDGFSSTGIDVSPVVDAQQYDYVAPSDVMRDFADTLGWGWWIDYDKVVHLTSLSSMVAPVTNLLVDSDVTNYGDLVLHETVAQEKNRVYIKGFRIKSSGTYNRSFTGDGSTKFFLLGYEPSAITDVTATRAGTPQVVGTDIIDSSPDSPQGGANNVYVCFDNMGLRYDVAPANGDAISVTFNYMFDGFSMVEDVVAQAVMAAREGGDGVHEYIVNDPSLTSATGGTALADAKGNRILTRVAEPRLTGTFNSFTQGWRAGQSFTLTSTARFGGLAQTVYVQQVRKRLVNHPSGGTPTLRYEITFADSASPTI
jgi:hypothetical protein